MFTSVFTRYLSPLVRDIVPGYSKSKVTLTVLKELGTLAVFISRSLPDGILRNNTKCTIGKSAQLHGNQNGNKMLKGIV